MLLALQLSGSVNPYLRTWPFPPLHINVNYLVDPRAYALSREFDPLYDEHKEGVFAPGRAEPIVVPGVPATPFDPNERARPVSSTPPVAPWQKFQTAVKDLFSDDEDDDESVQTPQRPKEKVEQSRGPRWSVPRLGGGGGGERSTSAPASPPRKGSPPDKQAPIAPVPTVKAADVPAAQRNAAASTVATEASAPSSATASAPKFGRYSERIRQARAAAQQESAAASPKEAPASSRS